MNLLFFYLSLIFSCLCLSTFTLEFVQIIFRHGQRTPTPFPGMSHVISEQFPGNLGFLTELGKRQGYELGKLLHDRYGSFLSDSYNESEFFLSSGDENRTAATALTFLSGFFPVVDPETNWHPNISWRPIPIHTDPRTENIQITKFGETCPSMAQKIKTSASYQKLWGSLLSRRKFLEKNLGIELHDFGEYCLTVNGLFSMRAIGTVAPVWWTEEVEQNLMPTTTWSPLLRNVPGLLTLTAGPWLDEILSRISTFVVGTSAHKIVAYSDHAEAILSIVEALNLTVAIDALEKLPPGPYCNYLLIEIHKRHGRRYVEVYFRNFTTGMPDHVKMATCQDPCPLDMFEKLVARHRITYDDFEYYCNPKSQEIMQENIAKPLLITLAVILGVTTVLMSFSYYKLRTQVYGSK